MKQTARIISTYSADVMGVCSALFELGGMTVMHDASGCNSTYTTHDEPRWYDMDSMVYISGVSEMEAIMGDDGKLIDDIVDAASGLHPSFIAIAGTPIPAMTGFDFEACAEVIEQRTGIPCYGFPTTGMNTYVHGASMAFEGIARRLPDVTGVGAKSAKSAVSPSVRLNILGLTPLDFSINGTDRSLSRWLERRGFEVISRWAMGSPPDEIRMSGIADVNLVVSASGAAAAEVLRERFGTPYVTGLPVGARQGEIITAELTAAARHSGADDNTKREMYGSCTVSDLPGEDIILIGEGVTNLALANAIELETGRPARVLCATECPDGILREKDRMAPDEDDIIPEIQTAGVIIADSLYRPICPPGAKFVSLPSEGFSGRIFRDDIPDLIADPDSLLKRLRT